MKIENNKQYEGIATIEITNSKTGKKSTKVEHNLITNAVPDILKENLYGLMDFSNVNIANDLMSGVVLFDESLIANASNTDLLKKPSAWAGNTKNTSGVPERGSFNSAESTLLPNGFKLVWDFKTSEANGTFKSMALTNPYLCNSDVFGQPTNIEDFRKLYHLIPIKRKQCYNNIPNNLKKQWWGTNYIDTKNNYWYRLEITGVSGNYANQINIYRSERGLLSVPPGQVNSFEGKLEEADDTISKGFICRNTQMKTITLTSPLFYNPKLDTRSVSFHDNNLYIFSIRDNSKKLRIIKIDLSTFDNETVTFTDKTNTYSNLDTNFQGFFSKLSDYFFTDIYPLSYPYIFMIMKDKSSYNCYKININDTADITKTPTILAEGVQPLANPYYAVGYQSFARLSNKNWILDWPKCYFYINMDTNQSYIGNLNSRTEYYSSNQVSVCPITKHVAFGFDYNGEMRANINPFYMATINNVSTFTKTPDDVMKITYVIKEV